MLPSPRHNATCCMRLDEGPSLTIHINSSIDAHLGGIMRTRCYWQIIIVLCVLLSGIHSTASTFDVVKVLTR
jgi:hypothetical protein